MNNTVLDRVSEPAVGVPSDSPARLSVVVSHSGKQHAYRHALALQQLGCLRRFLTSTYYRPERWPDRIAARIPPLDRYLSRRRLDGLGDRVVRWPWLEAPETLTRAVLGNTALVADLVRRRDAAFDRRVAGELRRNADADVFWGFQGSCCDSLAAARAVGMTAVLELATGHAPAAERILGAERERHPEWADSLSNAGFPSWYRQRLDDETRRADYCVVASTFTRKTLVESGVPDRRVLTLPLGADLARFTTVRRPSGGPFQILFVGGVGQRKGIKYLLDAWNRIRGVGVRLVVAGPMVGSGRAFREAARGVAYVGRADADEVIRHMHRSHVLVLPSLFEGFGLVIVEAMATGMPVIASTHSAAPDIIRDGRDGFVIAPDDVETLAGRLAALVADRSLAEAMGAEAAIRARQYSWDVHRQRLGRLCESLARARSGVPDGR